MEKNTPLTVNMSNYAKQLDEIRHLAANLNYSRAITRCYHLMDQLTEAPPHANEAVQLTLNDDLVMVYKLLQNNYFDWLMLDPNQFCQNQKAKKDLLKNLKDATTMEYFTEEERQHCQFLVCFIKLLFSHGIERDALQEVRISFCALYDTFVQYQHKFNQALVLLGFALIAAYEGDLSSTYQGLNHVLNTYPKMHKLVKAIEYQLPRTMSSLDKDNTFLINPLAKFRLPEMVASLRLRL